MTNLEWFMNTVRLQAAAHDMSAINRYTETQAFGRPLTTAEVDRAVERDRQDEAEGRETDNDK